MRRLGPWIILLTLVSGVCYQIWLRVPGLERVELLEEARAASQARWSKLEAQAKDPTVNAFLSTGFRPYWDGMTSEDSEVRQILDGWLASHYKHSRGDENDADFEANRERVQALFSRLRTELERPLLVDARSNAREIQNRELADGLERLASAWLEAGDGGKAVATYALSLRLGRRLLEARPILDRRYYGRGSRIQLRACWHLLESATGQWDGETWVALSEAVLSERVSGELKRHYLEDLVADILEEDGTTPGLGKGRFERTLLNILSRMLLELEKTGKLSTLASRYEHPFAFLFREQVLEATNITWRIEHHIGSIHAARRLMLGVGVAASLRSELLLKGKFPNQLDQSDLAVDLEGVSWDPNQARLTVTTELTAQAASDLAQQMQGPGWGSVQGTSLVFDVPREPVITQ